MLARKRYKAHIARILQLEHDDQLQQGSDCGLSCPAGEQQTEEAFAGVLNEVGFVVFEDILPCDFHQQQPETAAALQQLASMESKSEKWWMLWYLFGMCHR